MRAKSLAVCAALAGLVLIAAPDNASACCYPTFERNKPHVNVGTIGHLPSSGQQTGQSANSTNRVGGRLRRTKPRKGEQRELLILITPHLTTPTN